MRLTTDDHFCQGKLISAGSRACNECMDAEEPRVVRKKSHEKTQAEIDASGYMPDRFVSAYLELTRVGMQQDIRGQSFDNQSKKPKKPYREDGGGLKDERALRFKAWVDRQLRAIGRDVQAYLNARDGSGPSPIAIPPATRRQIARQLEQQTELHCRNKDCEKYVSWQWTYCAWCGHSVSSGNNKSNNVTMNVSNVKETHDSGVSSEP